MRAEYTVDYSTAVRGKYHRRLMRGGANVVLLDPDVAKVFRSSEQVNEALRKLLDVRSAVPATSRRTRTRARP